MVDYLKKNHPFFMSVIAGTMAPVTRRIINDNSYIRICYGG